MKTTNQPASLQAIKFLYLSFFLFILPSCEKPFSLALHSPIYPSASDTIIYTLELKAGLAPNEVRLFKQLIQLTVLNIPFGGPYLIRNPAPERLLTLWRNPSIRTLSFCRTEASPLNSLIKYRFEIKQDNGMMTQHKICFATQNYPLEKDPVPVYEVGSQSNTLDIVFIPDTDITDQISFRDHSRRNIREAYLVEPTTKYFRHSFNFYINPFQGHATDFDRTDKFCPIQC